MANKLTLLTDEQIWGDEHGDGQLQVMKAYGTRTGLSDLAIALGGNISRRDTHTTSDGQRSGLAWTASSTEQQYVRVVCHDGERNDDYPYERLNGVRPVLLLSGASLTKMSAASPSRNIEGVDIVEYDEYPQTLAEEAITRELEQAFSTGKLQKTGKTYNFDAAKYRDYCRSFVAEGHAEYQYGGKGYIRVKARPYFSGTKFLNGTEAEEGKFYWIEVQPIEWLKDPSGVLVARQVILAGVQVDCKKIRPRTTDMRLFSEDTIYDGRFKNTFLHKYLNNVLLKEMDPARGNSRLSSLYECLSDVFAKERHPQRTQEKAVATTQPETPTTCIAELEAQTTEKPLKQKTKASYDFRAAVKSYAEKEAIRDQLGRAANGGHGGRE